jgi:hypothetical protein
MLTEIASYSKLACCTKMVIQKKGRLNKETTFSSIPNNYYYLFKATALALALLIKVLFKVYS